MALLGAQAWLSGAGDAARGLSVPVWASAAAIVLAAALLGTVVAVLATAVDRPRMRRTARSTSAARRAPWPVQALAVAVPIAILGVFVAVAALERPSSRPVRPAASPQLDAGRGRAAARAPARDARRVASGWWWAAGGAALLSLAATVVLLRPGAHLTDERAARKRLGEAAAALDDAALRLREARDPRGAILAAYARMEEVLGAVGLARAPSEAPREYLSRVEPRADAVDPARRLTELYELARFADVPVTEPMRRAALAAVEDLRRTTAVAGR